MRFRPPKIIKRLYPAIIWNFYNNVDNKSVYLTFDDGPNPFVTPWVLEQLDKYNAKATFFCLGKNVEQHPDIYKMILEKEHSTGNHSYSHVKGFGVSVGRYVEDFDFAEEFIQSNLLRPPYARCTPRQIKMLSRRFYIIMMDIVSRDYSNKISQRHCLRNVTKYVQAGSIIGLHDSEKSEKNIKYVLPRLLEFLNEKGFECKPIIL
ncbi:MAG: polysaccharide deacetylase family protein [Prevotellaceae bacterium]|jgi:peptidoglycan/xylan/chitin deacetylase (PgdA/CDA1 family)|nr:polysaccharide deacetylase family protein [Prevotellaceae bacterium]